MRKILFSILGLMLLSACQTQPDNLPSAEIVSQIQSAQVIHPSVAVKLVPTKITPKTFKVSILLDNSEQKPINSARTWLAYNPSELRIVTIETQNSDFNLSAPGEENYDAEKGLIQIGRSKTDQPLNLKMLQMAEITVEKIQTGATILDFYDYQKDATGHTTVNMLLDGTVYNLATEPITPALVIE